MIIGVFNNNDGYFKHITVHSELYELIKYIVSSRLSTAY